MTSGRGPTDPPLASEIRPNPNFPSPNGMGASIIDFQVGPPGSADLELDFNPAFVSVHPHPLQGKMYFVGTPITDYYSGGFGYNSLSSSFSVYDPYLSNYNLTIHHDPRDAGYSSPYDTQAEFTLNRYTFNAAHNYLLPRAVGYSAGLINYFFRGVGKLSVTPTTADPEKSELTNHSPEPLNGTFFLYYDTTDNVQVTRHGAISWDTPSGGLAPNQTMPIPSFPTPEPNGTNTILNPGQYLLVLRGTLGEEEDTAVTANPVYILCASGDCSPDGGGGGGPTCLPSGDGCD